MPLLNFVAGTKGSHEVQTRLLKMQCHLQDSGSTAGRGSGPQFLVIFPPEILSQQEQLRVTNIIQQGCLGRFGISHTNPAVGVISYDCISDSSRKLFLTQYVHWQHSLPFLPKTPSFGW